MDVLIAATIFFGSRDFVVTKQHCPTFRCRKSVVELVNNGAIAGYTPPVTRPPKSPTGTGTRFQA